MKIVNKFILLITFTFFCSCKENIKLAEKSKFDNSYNPDSLFYHINANRNQGNKMELFLITKSITVADSIFGGYNNYDNWIRAWQFMKSEHPEAECPNFIYKIHIYKNSKFIEFASIIYDSRDISYPILRQGNFSNINSNTKKSKLDISNYLRIIEINNINLNSKCINLMYDRNKWKVISKEIFNHSSNLEYCIDTTDNDFSLIKMNINYVFDYPQSSFNCN